MDKKTVTAQDIKDARETPEHADLLAGIAEGRYSFEFRRGAFLVGDLAVPAAIRHQNLFKDAN